MKRLRVYAVRVEKLRSPVGEEISRALVGEAPDVVVTRPGPTVTDRVSGQMLEFRTVDVTRTGRIVKRIAPKAILNVRMATA